MVGKPAVVTRVVDSMTDNPRPTRAEATDVANAVLDGSDAIILGAEALRGLYPVEFVSTVGKICAELSSGYPFVSGRTARLIAKYRPTMPVISVVIPRLKTNQLRWTFSGAFEAESKSGTNESVLTVALDHGKASDVIKPHDRVVVC
ncbi:Detected protein of confused Function [Hibiscus syriacus]|uniref:pyruvate kinase n=1 Tax=Hibiscus syriacus TaxID=106335 RepID=A0A6A3A846_HIBSY|nr:Detected protein of confused Function [Hibiscus syriacus]